MSQGSPFDRRRAGLSLHPTSLPGGYDNGDLGPEAYRLVDFMAACGFTIWQTLPLGPPHDDLSPYSAQSVHAGNPRLIALEPLVEAGWLKLDEGPRSGEDGWTYPVSYTHLDVYKRQAIRIMSRKFMILGVNPSQAMMRGQRARHALPFEKVGFR